MHEYLRRAGEQKEETIRTIQGLVECESPSGDRDGIRRVQQLLKEHSAGLAAGKTLPGDHLRLQFGPRRKSGSKQILVLAHADTVWQKGTLAAMPFRRDRKRLWGPGVLDMKAGIVFFLHAMRILRHYEKKISKPVVLLVVSDEEIGSPHSRALTEKEALQSESVLVLEPGTGLTGELKTSRKGVGRYVVAVHGQAAHAGVDFSSGASAIVEISRQIDKLFQMTDLTKGTTVNPGVISGGTRSNVIAGQAQLEIDVRVTTAREAIAVDKKIRALRPIDKRCKLKITGGINRPPMQRTKQIGQLFDQAASAALELGFQIEESATGGGSDGNFTAALGIPTLDGLGAVGEGAHADNESVLIEYIPQRVALLAKLIEKLQQD